jgi:hypothetical protein
MKYIALLLVALLMLSCGKPKEVQNNTTVETSNKQVEVPQFNGDSAYFLSLLKLILVHECLVQSHIVNV